MIDTMSTENLQPGQNPAGLPEGGRPGEIGVGRLPVLGSGSAAGATALKEFEAAGMVEESPEEMGGGGEPIDDWVVKKGGYDKLLQQIQQNGWGDSLVWKLDDGTKLSVAEVKRRAAAVSPPPPEPRPAPRPGDWKANLPPDQRQRLQTFETKIINFDPSQLQMLLNRLKELQTLALTDGWQGKEIMEGDAVVYSRLIEERLKGGVFSNGGDQEFHKMSRSARVTGWRPPPDKLDPRIDLSAGGTNGIVEKGK